MDLFDKNNNFQIFLLIGFGFLALIGFIVFATNKGSSKNNEDMATGTVLIWGVVPVQNMQAVLAGVKNKIYLISYESIPSRVFSARYVDNAQTYLRDGGILALPMAIDPLLMFYNKRAFDSAFITEMPKTWKEFIQNSQLLSFSDATGKIERSFTAMGTFRNIKNAQALLTLLILQTENPIISIALDKYQSMITENTKEITEALEFFMSFSDEAKENYSWNSAQPIDFNSFISEQLAIYFGFASEYNLLKKKNPNLSFSVALIPQTSDKKYNLTFAKMNSIAISKVSKNIYAAYSVAMTLSGPEYAKAFASSIGLASPLRSDLAVEQSVEKDEVIRKSAILSRNWLNPNKSESRKIFLDMITNIRAGVMTAEESVGFFDTELRKMIARIK